MTRDNDPISNASPAEDDEPAQSADEQVGYGRPPIATRFRPGQSGTPRGRP